MSYCPLKEAARGAPNQIAILAKTKAWTFAELDHYVDQLGPIPLIVEAVPSPHLIALFFAAWRRECSLFPINPRLPQAKPIITAPPSSVLLYTSGSTGTPKIAVLPFSALLANAESAIHALDLRIGDQWRLTLPLYHVGGIGILFRCVLARATIVLDDSPNITHLSYVPTHLYRATPIYKHLRCLLLGGSPIVSYPSHLPVYTTYGLTEMGSMVALNGQILPGREVRLAEDGEIWVRGACLFQGYLDSGPIKDWFPTKDLGAFQNGKLTILGRKDWMFISGGENIQPEEIERELLALPEVIEAAVLPIDDPEFGKRPAAFVHASADFNLKKMQDALRDKLPKYKIPVALLLMNELPKKSNFKVDRFILSQLINNK